MIKLLGNTVLVEPLPDADMQKSASGIFLVNRYKKSNLKFRVLAVGPGELRRRLKRSGKRVILDVLDKPEVEPGDCVLTRALLDDGIIKEALEDGTGRLIIYSQGILAKWKENG